MMKGKSTDKRIALLRDSPNSWRSRVGMMFRRRKREVMLVNWSLRPYIVAKSINSLQFYLSLMMSMTVSLRTCKSKDKS
jgi:hypothetical protein